MTEDSFRDAVLRAAHWALSDDDSGEEERRALADDLNDAWPTEIPSLPIDAQARQMDPDLRYSLRSEGIPDDQVFVAAYALAHLVKFGEPFRPA
ncbi:MAG: hypothetical protein AAF637_02790 [Pseudomonadota bacterium]